MQALIYVEKGLVMKKESLEGTSTYNFGLYTLWTLVPAQSLLALNPFRKHPKIAFRAQMFRFYEQKP